MVKNLPANAGEARDTGSISGLGKSPGGGHGNLSQYSCLENSMDRGAWRAIVHGVAESQLWLNSLSLSLSHTHTHTHPRDTNSSVGVAWCSDYLVPTKCFSYLYSILKSKDITLPTKFCLVKTMVFPVVMHGCENWTVKKAECQKTDAFELWCWLLRLNYGEDFWESLRPQGDPTSSS